MKMKMELKQTHTVSQRMLQKMNILQMNSLELHQYVTELTLENPMLDYADKTDEQPLELVSEEKWMEQPEELSDYDPDTAERDKTDNLFFCSLGESLEKYVADQFWNQKLSGEEKKTLEYLILCLDSRGYLMPEWTQAQAICQVNTDTVERMKQLLQTAEPAGIGATDLRECLLLQLERQNAKGSIAWNIVDSCLDLLAQNKLPQITACLSIEMEQVKEALEQIHRLNPKPGNGFSDEKETKFIYPDIVVDETENGYEIHFQDRSMDGIRLNPYYLRLAEESGQKEVTEYLNRKKYQASWVLQCIETRRQTLRKIVECLLKEQKDFFEQGPSARKTLLQKDVAEKTALHEATVSRAVSGKYLQCKWGVFALADFFSRPIRQGEEDSALQLQRQIRELIRQEDKKHPLSDQKISDLLKEKGSQISRRTVTKYREQMNIGDTRTRKQY